ncbi:hypothetical protein F5Y08DRAFT_338317 [Xylaria arbuscula]|nr:hypothetical protein F5Y08DRAFT_338317 [Xylaria arbuscula]
MKLSVNIIIVVTIARDFIAVSGLVVIIAVSSFLFIIDLSSKAVEEVIKISAILIAISEFLVFDIAKNFVKAQVNFFFLIFSIVYNFVCLVIANSSSLRRVRKPLASS